MSLRRKKAPVECYAYKHYSIYARRLYEDFAANTKCHTIKNCRTVETPGEELHNSNRL